MNDLEPNDRAGSRAAGHPLADPPTVAALFPPGRVVHTVLALSPSGPSRAAVNALRRTVRRAACLVPALVSFASAQTPPVEPNKGKGDLGQRLIRKAADESDEDMMSGIIRLMNEAARKLEVEFEPGTDTQAIQQQVLEQLDDAIKEAASRRRMQSPDQQKSTGDMRRRPSKEPPPTKRATAAKPGAVDPNPPENTATPGGAEDARNTGGSFRESRRTWGQLPEREREEIIQGAGEGYLERYRAAIERYYRALQEAGE
ncbi:MAG: hypothetical protein HY763_13495 [Planctomycetes bacterium]|nr:hypothetical protein [Planctomycetota bacterium]